MFGSMKKGITFVLPTQLGGRTHQLKNYQL